MKIVAVEQLRALAGGEDGEPPSGLPASVAALRTPGSLLDKRLAGNTDGLKDTSGSGAALSIATILVGKIIPTGDIEAAVRWFMQQQGSDKANRPDWIKTTVGKAYEFVRQRAKQNTDDAVEPITFQPITCIRVASMDHHIPYHIEGTIAVGQPLIVAAQQKTMKTSIMLDAGVSVATGTRFLGRQFVPRVARVLLMSGESGLATIKETLLRITRGRGLELAGIDNLLICDRLPKFGNPAHLDALRQCLIDNAIEVLVIDPAYLSMPGADAGNLFTQGELLGAMNAMCQELGITLILVHHTRKAHPQPRFQVPELADIAWAGFPEFARQWLLIGRREKFIPGSGLHRLWLNVGGSAGHSNIWAVDIDEGEYQPGVDRKWEVTVRTAKEARDHKAESRAVAKVEQTEADRQRIREALTGNEGETLTAIRDAAGLSNKRASDALAHLVASGAVRKCRIRKGNRRAYDAYQLAV